MFQKSSRILACNQLAHPPHISSRWERLKLFRKHKMPPMLIKSSQIMVIAAVKGLSLSHPEILALKRRYTPELWLMELDIEGSA